MKKLVRKDAKKRKKILISEKKRFIFKTIINNYSFKNELKKKCCSNLYKKLSPNFLTQVNNRCIITRRKKNLNKFFKFSRLSFLRLVRSGYLFGFRKSSW